MRFQTKKIVFDEKDILSQWLPEEYQSSVTFVSNYKEWHEHVGSQQVDLVVLNDMDNGKMWQTIRQDLVSFDLKPSAIIVSDDFEYNPDAQHPCPNVQVLNHTQAKKWLLPYVKLSERIIEKESQFTEAKKFIPRLLHEIKNPAVIVTAELDAVKDEIEKLNLTDDHEINKRLEKLKKAHLRLNEIMSSMAGLDGNYQHQKAEPISLQILVRNIEAAIEAVKAQFPECPEIPVYRKKLADSVKVQFNDTHLQQIIVNLIKNSWQALNGNSSPSIRVELMADIGNYLTLSVIDNGPGVPLEYRGKIFRSSFSTKSNKDSSGIGLAVCRKIAHQNESELMLDGDSKETKFDLLIPIAS